MFIAFNKNYMLLYNLRNTQQMSNHKYTWELDRVNRFVYIILVLIFGCFVLAGSGYFKPTAMPSSTDKQISIDKQSSENSDNNKTDNNINKSPSIEEPDHNDKQNNKQNSDNSSNSPEETNKAEKPKQSAQNNQKNNDSAMPSNKNNQPNYRIEVSTSEQKVRIYDNDTLIKEWTVSTGKNNSTPLGDFTIQNRGEWFFSEKYQEGAMWWVSFKDWGIYLFHSVPMDRNKNIIQEEADKLGSPASHGCIRMRVEHAKWIYDNIPEGTPVHIE
ncbi:MAG: L,D-transpeptidase family protein [Thermacetogeniaceae bacterium]